MFIDRYPDLRSSAATVAVMATIALGGCKETSPSHPVNPLEVDSVVLVYAHGIPGSAPVGEAIREGMPQTFQNAWGILHEVTGTVPEEVKIQIAGNLALGEDTGKMSDICSDSSRSKLFDDITDAARKEYRDEVGDEDLLTVVMQRADGFACDDESEHEHGPTGSASMYGRNIVFYDGDRVAIPGGERIVVHELGHALLDFEHNGIAICEASCEFDEYGDRYTVMGSGGVLTADRFLNSFEERRLGNIHDAQIVTLEDGAHNLRLFSLDSPQEDVYKIIRLPMSPQSLGAIHEQTGATAAYIELSPVDVSGLGVKTYLVDERVFEGAEASPSYLLSPRMPGARHYMREGETVIFPFSGSELRIEVREMQYDDRGAGSADVKVILQ